ncbi:MAG: hypothetical protein ACR2PX_13835 [Endozoicomonas sp.]|uniref:hypothetical protein n=1 Tax=Endozoicomonas sp. TaxID=1892382 RepID=UPI003D9BF8EE
MIKKALLLASTSLMVACAYNSAPVVGPHDKTEAEYQQDVAKCHEYAAKVDKGEAAKTGAINAGILGAVTGAAVGLVEGDGIDGAVVGGAVVGGVAGASAGAAGGAMKSTEDQAYVLRRCLAGKGYDVLDLRP